MLYVVYVAAALVVGWLGRYKTIGFVGFFLLALAITPLIAAVILMVAHDRRPRAPS
jgi:hypothetical protein